VHLVILVVRQGFGSEENLRYTSLVLVVVVVVVVVAAAAAANQQPVGSGIAVLAAKLAMELNVVPVQKVFLLSKRHSPYCTASSFCGTKCKV